tara:strand:- start:447 stop:719 length:273 start_codon:yes stop_codon:yes gene_type:complete
MHDLILEAFTTAINNSENWTKDGVNWDFIDADVFMAVGDNIQEASSYNYVFEHLADLFDTKYGEDAKYDENVKYSLQTTKEFVNVFGEIA